MIHSFSYALKKTLSKNSAGAARHLTRTIKNQDTRFLPVLLGTDANCYGMARAFHEAYGITSLALGKYPLLETRHSRIVEVHTHPEFEKPAVFLDTLDKVASLYQGYYNHLILIACGDRYAELLSMHRDVLRARFIVPYVADDLRRRLENKADFYAMCEAHGLPHPKTVVLQKGMPIPPLPFDFPVALKANDSIEYVLLDFPGKKKSYQITNAEELAATVGRIYDAGYGGALIIQDFIPGGDENMFVLNSYSNAQGKVQMMCLGQNVLSDLTPAGIGNYNAVIQKGDSGLYDTYQTFLETVGFEGFSNVDVKLDPRDGQYKAFEINIRQGRSSYFATASGCNLASWLVRDQIEGINLSQPHRHHNPYLWLHVPKTLVLDYAPDVLMPEVRRLLNEKRVSNTLLYSADQNPLREWRINRFYRQQRARYEENR